MLRSWLRVQPFRIICTGNQDNVEVNMKINLIIALLIISEQALAVDSYLCTQDTKVVIEYNKETKAWMPSKQISKTKYLLKKPKYQKSVKWELFEYKNNNEHVLSISTENFNENGYITLFGYVDFVFNKKNLRFALTNTIPYLDEQELNNPNSSIVYTSIGKCTEYK